jgi:hypothetical protein
MDESVASHAGGPPYHSSRKNDEPVARELAPA